MTFFFGGISCAVFFSFRTIFLMKENIFSDSVVSRVYENLACSGFSGGKLCVGVSGGADSICLLTALVEMFETIADNLNTTDISGNENVSDNFNISDSARAFHKQIINVITVNHRIRSEKESGGDCEFVKKYCEKISSDRVEVNCEIVNLEEGQVFAEAEKRGRGIEEAARYLRYKAFEECAIKVLNERKSDDYDYDLNKFFDNSFNNDSQTKIYFATAHNQNDQVETLVMRFLQGASGFSRCGILEKREVVLNDGNIEPADNSKTDINSSPRKLIYVRPLLNITRSEIEKYLFERKISYKTDCTNSDNNYLRNRIRNVILPVLRENCPGFESSLLAGREKALFESEFIEKSAGLFEWKVERENDSKSVKVENRSGSGEIDEISFDAEKFYGLDMVLRQNLLYKAFEMLDVKTRIPYGFVKEVTRGLLNSTLNKDGIEAAVLNGKLVIKKQKKNQTNCGFFDIIEGECFREYDFGTLFSEHVKDGFCDLKFVTNDGQIFFLNKVKIPFCFRSRSLSDEVLTKDKGKKTVSDVLSDFKIKSEYKNLVPVVEELDEKKIRAVWGEIFGYKNWIVIE